MRYFKYEDEYSEIAGGFTYVETEDGATLRQLTVNGDRYLASNIRDPQCGLCLGEGQVNYDELIPDLVSEISEQEFEGWWESVLAAHEPVWQQSKGRYPPDATVQGPILLFYPQGVLIELDRETIGIMDDAVSQKLIPAEKRSTGYNVIARTKAYDERQHWVILDVVQPDDVSQKTWERWCTTWALAGLSPQREPFERLCALYGEPQRGYHNLAHIAACLRHAEATRALQQAPAEVELALWYHDAIYDSTRGDNEERSAELAARELEAQGLGEAARERVREYILATRHPSRPDNPDARLVVDIDLSILGAEPVAFDAYEAGIRQEYAWVPELVFRQKRGELLEQLLAAERLFLTEHFHALLEERARANLRRSLHQLGQLLSGVTDTNIHPEISTGDPVGGEVW
jgi:predicted metal-dependent HD superfamily phosphohydrolase